MLAEQGAKLTLLDKSQDILNEAICKLVNRGFLVANIPAVSIEDWSPDTEYDIVLFTNVLHLISPDKQKQALDNVLGSLKSGGTFIFTYLADNGPIPKSLKDYIIQHLKIEEPPISEGFYPVYDLPHKGFNTPHKHLVYFLVGTKK